MGRDSTADAAEKFTSWTVVILLGLGVIQIILGETISKSVALTANGIDCIGDGFVSVVVWVGLQFFRRPADHKFHYGYYKIENIASIGAAVVMFLLAGYIVYRSYLQFIDPHDIQAPLTGIVVALIAAFFAWGIGIKKWQKGRQSNLKSLRLEALNTLKDGTASFLAVVALVVSMFGYPIADALVGFIIAGVIISIGFAAIKEAGYMLVDACDLDCFEKSKKLKTLVEEFDLVQSAHVVRLRRTGPIIQGEIEILVSENMTVKEVNDIRKTVRKMVKETFPEIKHLSIIPVSGDIEDT